MKLTEAVTMLCDATSSEGRATGPQDDLFWPVLSVKTRQAEETKDKKRSERGNDATEFHGLERGVCGDLGGE